MSTSAPHILVACVGNIFLGDDAFGVEMAPLLLHRQYPSGVEICDFGIRGADLAYALLGDYESALEALGPFPAIATDIPPYVLMRGRIALWRNDREGAAKLTEQLLRSEANEIGKFRMAALLAIVRTGTLTDEAVAQIDASLPLEVRFQPRRIAFHAQVRTEAKLGGGRVEAALADLRVADANGLLDILWLDRCALFDKVRDRPEFIAIRKSTGDRAERVADVLDPKST
jgi:hypothetical protein